MIPSAPINDRYDTCRSRWLAASRGQARIRLRDSQPAALPIVSRNLQPARSPRRAHPGSTAKRSQQPLRPNPIKLAIGAPVRMAFHIRNCVGTRDDRSFAVQWLACALPCRRFAGALADVCARLGADVDRSGRIEARIGLRMMPTFPRSPLSFRTAGFPQYGWKAGLSDGAFLARRPT